MECYIVKHQFNDLPVVNEYILFKKSHILSFDSSEATFWEKKNSVISLMCISYTLKHNSLHRVVGQVVKADPGLNSRLGMLRIEL